jgi:hypothetical protein
MGASITVTVDYTDNAPHDPASPATVTENADGPFPPYSLSGSGSSSGASTDKTEPSSDGKGTDQTKSDCPIPKGAKFTKATVKISMKCPNSDPSKTIELEASGDVSVTASVEGNCITTTAVSTSTDGRVTKTKTSIRKVCC